MSRIRSNLTLGTWPMLAAPDLSTLLPQRAVLHYGCRLSALDRARRR